MKLPTFLALFLAAVLSAPAADSIVVFNEIQYHPLATQQEFIELRNLNGVDVNVGGWHIEGGIDYTIPAGTIIAGGGYLVIGGVPGAIGNFTGQLDNGGETLRLRNLNGRIMDELQYDDTNDWPEGADGSGATLARRNPNAASGPAAWAASTQVGGTPGAQNFSIYGSATTTAVQTLTGAWKYESSGTNLGTSWTAPGFDDSAWKSGNAPFYFGNPGVSATPATAVTNVGVWSMERWTGDADSQISTSKTYTHKVDLGRGTATVLNGVTFDAAGTARSGTNWTLSGTPNLLNNTSTAINTMAAGTGSNQLLNDFVYGSGNSPETLDLSGLTANQSYTLTFYCTGYDVREVRRVRVTPDNTGIPVILDQGSWGKGKGHLVKYRYKAPASGKLSIDLTGIAATAASWHQYAFTNEVSAALPAEAKVTTAVTVESSSSAFTNRAAINSVNSSGLDLFGDHSTTGDANMWQSNGTAAAPTDPLPADITWVLSAPTTLSGLRVWNFNELLNPAGAVTDNTTRGVKDVQILVSPDASGETFTSVGTFVVPQAFGCAAEIGTRLGFASPQANVRRVRLVATTNWGDANGFAGLSEVQFLTAGTLLTANPVTTRYRTKFNLTGAASSLYSVTLQSGVDDAAVFYLNGSEIYRTNISGTVAFTTNADSDIAVPQLGIATVPTSAFTPGLNTLAVELHQSASGAADAWFTSAVSINETPQPAASAFILNEIAGASDPAFFIELKNTLGTAMDTSGWRIATNAGQSVTLPAQTVAAGGYASFNAAALGFTPVVGGKIFLFAPGGTELRDAHELTNRDRGLLADGRWGHPTSPTAGTANVATVSSDVVFNEIFYNAPNHGAEQWVELYNRNAAAVDIGLWKISDAVSFGFPAGTMISGHGYLVVAWSPSLFAALHPGVAALGPWSGSLSGHGETITLRDAADNIVNRVPFSDSGRWSSFADGGGSSLELIDSNADNSRGEAWDASDESSHSTWQNVSYSGLGTVLNGDSTLYNELVVGMLTGGECLIDDVSVKDANLGNAELIQNGGFSGGTAAAWRIIGDHHASVVDDPTQPGNKVLKLVATGGTEHMNNHAETTLKNGGSYVALDATHTYTISLRAKWLRGTNRLHTRLWFNRLATQTLLNMPSTGGTPGALNSRSVANLGPTFDALAHTPVVPAASVPATVSVKVGDNDGIASVELFTSVNGAAFTSSAMTASGEGIYTGTVAGQNTGALVQFYVRATDTLGAVSVFPAGGVASRAIIPWDDGKAQFTLASGAHPHNLRLVMTGADATEFYKLENVMSNDFIPCTVIWDEREVYYRAGVRLKSSEHGRFDGNRVGYVIEFGDDELFLGTHGTIAIDRSGGTTTGQKEILIKTTSNAAGGIIAMEDDLIRVIAPVATGTGAAFTGLQVTGPAELSKARFDKEYLDNQWASGSSGPLFKYDLTYILTQTIDPNTRALTTIGSGNILSAAAENLKTPQSGAEHPGVSVVSLGSDKEVYRWHWLIKNAHSDDDYSGVLNLTAAIGQTGNTAGFNTQTAQYVDVNGWLRSAIPANLFGVQDNYLGVATSQHNTLVFFPPGGKATLLPWDLDYLAQTNATAPLDTGGDISKFILNPVNKRIYYGHMLDILNRSFNTTFLTRWAQHYATFTADDYSSSLTFLNARAQFARDKINGQNGQTAPIPVVAFGLTSGSPVTVNTPFATISGVGWINVAEIRLQGSAEPLAVTWTDDKSWTLQLPVSAGTNTYTLVAYDSTGAAVGSTAVTVTGAGGIYPAGPGNLVVSELNYNPAVGQTTEFIELLNITGATLDLTGCHFEEEAGQGIIYAFASGVQVPSGGRIIVARDRAAFAAMYPAASPLAAGEYNPSGLDNGGESIVLYAASGLEIFRFSYSDNITSTDGNGRTLVRVLSSTNPDPNSYIWRASTTNGGNPGGTDAVIFSGNPHADGDADGIPTLLEYALGTSDGAPGALPMTMSRDVAGNCFLTFTRAVNADDVTLTIEGTPSLDAPWLPATATRTANNVVGNIATETWQITVPSGSGPFFTRLKATQR